MKTPAFARALVCCLLLGCGSDASSVASAPDAASDAPSSDAGVDANAASGARTLQNCVTNIDPAAPEFYRTYFKCVTITVAGANVTVATEALPPHLSYYYGATSPSFAPFDTSRGAQYRANPNFLAQKNIEITVPAAPTSKGLIINAALVDAVVGTSTEEYGLGTVGVALDSVPLFNPLARPGDDIEAEKFTFDAYDAHPAPDGTYHYHRSSSGPLEVLAAAGLTTSTTPGAASVEVYGMMCDGTLVLGCTELDGKSPAAAGLDAQGGHVADVADGKGTVHFAARYHTHVCPTGRKYTPEIQFYTTCRR